MQFTLFQLMRLLLYLIKNYWVYKLFTCKYVNFVIVLSLIQSVGFLNFQNRKNCKNYN